MSYDQSSDALHLLKLLVYAIEEANSVDPDQ